MIISFSFASRWSVSPYPPTEPPTNIVRYIAGVLRGEKSRFQLFGDTVNTASRIESSGERNKIHLSADFAALLVQSGNESWVKAREGMIEAKGKGNMQTYWLIMQNGHKRESQRTLATTELSAREVAERMLDQNDSGTESGDSHASSSEDEEDDDKDAEDGGRRESKLLAAMNHKTQRLIHWNVEVLQQCLRTIVAARNKSNRSLPNIDSLTFTSPKGFMVRDEVVEVISLSTANGSKSISAQERESIELDREVRAQLEDYVVAITAMYNDNFFHCFEHASHVIMAITKMFTKVETKGGDGSNLDYRCHITSDPLIQFTCTLAALVHEVDHTGFTNSQMVAQKHETAQLYGNKSVSEQNAINLAWDLLMESSYKELRASIYSTQEELNRFRQLLVNSVLASDLHDQGLVVQRRILWEKAFPTNRDSSAQPESSRQDIINRKATAVLERMMQASDISPMTQHWQ
jgi:hypothetical protein